jgi:hypothetical protein
VVFPTSLSHEQKPGSHSAFIDPCGLSHKVLASVRPCVQTLVSPSPPKKPSHIFSNLYKSQVGHHLHLSFSSCHQCPHLYHISPPGGFTMSIVHGCDHITTDVHRKPETWYFFTKLALNLQSSCLSPPSAGIIGMCHHDASLKILSKQFKY